MSEPGPVTPLGGAALGAGLSARVAEIGGRGMIALRGDFADPAFAGPVAEAAGCAIPAVRRFAAAGDRRLSWMSPDELLLSLPRAEVATALTGLLRGFGAAHALAADVSDARAVFAIEGPGARETVAKGMPADLSPAGLAPGWLRRSHLGQSPAAVWALDDVRLELACFRSVAGFVFDWLVEGADARARPGLF